MKRSRSEEFNEKTKLSSSILWLLTKAYNNRIPPKFSKIFVTSQSGTYSIHPDLVTALTSGHVYCKACSNLFPDSNNRWNDFRSLFTQLAERGFPVVDTNGSFIRSESLQTAVSFYPEVHLHLMDTMMTARVADLVTIESVLKSIRSFSTTFLHAGSSTLQARTCEEALHLWLRCACRTGLKMASCGQMGDGGGDAVQDLASNLSDQQADNYTRQLAFATRLALLANFYAPDLLPFRSLYLGLHLTRNANIHNARRFVDFVASNLAASPVVHMSAEDIVRSSRPPTAGPLRINFNTMLAELYQQFEGQGSSFQPSCKVYFTYPVPRPSQPTEKLPEVDFSKSRVIDTAASLRSFRLDDDKRDDIYREKKEVKSPTPRPSVASPRRRALQERSFSLSVSSTPASPSHRPRRSSTVSNSAPGHNALEALFSPPTTPKRHHGTFTKNSLEVMRMPERESGGFSSGTFRLHRDGRRSPIRSIFPDDSVKNDHVQEEDDEAYLTPTEDEPDPRTTFARQLERKKTFTVSRQRSASTTSLPPVSPVSLTTRFNLRKSRKKAKEAEGRTTWAKLQRAPSLDGSPVASRKSKKSEDEVSVSSLPPSAEIQAALNRRKKTIEKGKAEAMKEAERVLQKRSHAAFAAKVLQQEKKDDVVATAAAEHERLSAAVQKHFEHTESPPLDRKKPSRAGSRTPTRFDEPLTPSRRNELLPASPVPPQSPSRSEDLLGMRQGLPRTPCRSEELLGVSPTLSQPENGPEDDDLETASCIAIPARREDILDTMSCKSAPTPRGDMRFSQSPSGREGMTRFSQSPSRREDLLEERVRVLQAEVDALKEHYSDGRPSSPAPSVQSWPAWSAPDGDYAISLDRLNTSLSDLQSEIARLSLQQERINKTLQNPAATLNKVLTSSTTSIGGNSQSGRATWSQRTPVTEILPATSAPTATSAAEPLASLAAMPSPVAPSSSPFIAPMPYFMAVPAQFSAPPWAGQPWGVPGPNPAPMDSPPAKPLSPDRLLPQKEEDEEEEEDDDDEDEDEAEEEAQHEEMEVEKKEEGKDDTAEIERQPEAVIERPKPPPPAGLFFVELGEQERPEAEGAAANEPRVDGGMAATSFVVDANTQDEHDIGEAQLRRKEQLLAASARRRQQAAKKDNNDSESARRRAADRVREAKKQEDKIRRETIYQAYLERKNGGEVEEGPAAAYSPTTRPSGVRGGGGRTRGPKAGVRGRGMLKKPNRAVSEERLHSDGRLTYQHRSQSSSAVSSNGNDSPSPSLKLYVQPRVKSNRSVIINALTHCCLAGTVNQSMLELVVSELQVVEGSHFMILFRDSGCQFRSLYIFNTSSEECHRMTGVGPRRIKHSMVHSFYKYNSGAKKFTEITSTNHLSPVVDAFTVFNKYWKKCPTCGGGVKNAQTRT